jgi:ribosomal protein S18 acetylase RimI-like enzyme
MDKSNTVKLKIKIEIKSSDTILKYFEDNEKIFSPPLRQRVHLVDYAKKIENNAVQYWLFLDDKIIGFAACYANDIKRQTAFITSFSIIDGYQGKKFASYLLAELILNTKTVYYKQIQLEVNVKNIPAINLYKKFGFKIYLNKEDTYIMNLLLSENE